MACFSLAWLQQLLVYLVIMGAVIACIRLLVPLITSYLGEIGATVGQIINIILYAIVLIMLIYIVFSLLSCLMGGSGFLPPSPHR